MGSRCGGKHNISESWLYSLCDYLQVTMLTGTLLGDDNAYEVSWRSNGNPHL
jgi:hypothetical protein